MSKRILAIVFFAMLAAAANAANDESCTRETLRPIAVAAHVDVAPLFEKNERGEEPPAGMEVVIARIAPDGTPVLACVDSAEGAKKFLESPIETVARPRKEQ
jgi:hypothetical protein